jgi:hypothetical protein
LRRRSRRIPDLLHFPRPAPRSHSVAQPGASNATSSTIATTKPLAQARAQRVPLDIAQHRHEMLVSFDGETLEASLIQRPGTDGPPRCVKALGVAHGEPVKETTHVTAVFLSRPDNKMPVIWHHTVREHPERQARQGQSDEVLERVVVARAAKQRHAPSRAVDDVIGQASNNGAAASRHGGCDATSSQIGMTTKDSRPLFAYSPYSGGGCGDAHARAFVGAESCCYESKSTSTRESDHRGVAANGRPRMRVTGQALGAGPNNDAPRLAGRPVRR